MSSLSVLIILVAAAIGTVAAVVFGMSFFCGHWFWDDDDDDWGDY